MKHECLLSVIPEEDGVDEGRREERERGGAEGAHQRDENVQPGDRRSHTD